MARNSLSPGYVRFSYTSNGHVHKQTLPVQPLAPAGSSTLLVDSSGAYQLWTAFVSDWVLLLKEVLVAADSIDFAEMWTQASPTAVPILQDTYSIGVAGVHAGSDTPWCQMRMSFRTKAGGRAAVTFLEPPYLPDLKYAAPGYDSTAALANIESYLTGSSACPWGRDNSYIASGIFAVSKTNDTLRKKFLAP